MNQIKKNSELPSVRSFGVLFTVVFAVLAVYGYIKGWGQGTWISLAALGVLTALTTLLFPGLLAPFNKGWFLLGNLLGKIVSPIVLGLIFFLILSPVGLVTRVYGRDALRLKRQRVSSYWIDRTPPGPAPDSFKNQF